MAILIFFVIPSVCFIIWGCNALRRDFMDIFTYRMVTSTKPNGEKVYGIERHKAIGWTMCWDWTTNYDLVLKTFYDRTESHTLQKNKNVVHFTKQK